jgi:predicted phosphatase
LRLGVGAFWKEINMKRLEILRRVIRVLSSVIIIPGGVAYADDGSVHTEEIVLATAVSSLI